MDILCLKDTGLGHVYLFESCCKWFGDNWTSTTDTNETAYVLMSYITYILNRFGSQIPSVASSDAGNNPLATCGDDDDDVLNPFASYDQQPDAAADVDDRNDMQTEDKGQVAVQTIPSNGDNDRSETNNNLNAKLCTFTVSLRLYRAHRPIDCQLLSLSL
jgi:hypothetical protein